MIVCSSCLQKVGLHRDTKNYYHLPPMNEHCDVGYVFALDLGKTPQRTVKIMKEMAEESNDLQARIDRAIGYIKVKDYISALTTLEGNDMVDCFECGGKFYFEDEHNYPAHCPNGCCWHDDDEECDETK